MPTNILENNTKYTISKWNILLIFLSIGVIIFLFYYIYEMNLLENEIDIINQNIISIDKKLTDTINTQHNKYDNYDKYASDITKQSLDIDRLNTIITSYINTSIQKNNNINQTNKDLSNELDLNTQLQLYISSNNEKLDNFILDTNDKLNEIIETKDIMMDSITNINKQLEFIQSK